MTDIAYWLKEYSTEVDQYTDILKTLQSLIDTNSTNNRKIIQTISQCDAKSIKIKDVKKSFGLEMRLIKDKQEKSEYNVKVAALDERLMILNKDLKLIKIKQNKHDLFEESTGKNQFSTEGLLITIIALLFYSFPSINRFLLFQLNIYFDWYICRKSRAFGENTHCFFFLISY